MATEPGLTYATPAGNIMYDASMLICGMENCACWVGRVWTGFTGEHVISDGNVIAEGETGSAKASCEASDFLNAA